MTMHSKSFLMNNEGISLWRSGQPELNIYDDTDGKPSTKLYHGEWTIQKSIFMQVINPFSEAEIAFSLTDRNREKIYSGSFKSFHKKARKLINLASSEEYEVFFKSKLLQNTSCELLKNNQPIFRWQPDDRGNAVIFQGDTPVADISRMITGTLAHYKRIRFLIDEVETKLVIAFIAIVYTY